MQFKTCLVRSVLALVFIVLSLIAAASFALLYLAYDFLRQSGYVRIQGHAIDYGNHIAVHLRVSNVDTKRYLTNFCFSFTSYQRGAYTVELTNFVPAFSYGKVVWTNVLPMLFHTNEYYVFGPSNDWDDQVIELVPHFALYKGDAFDADFVLWKTTNLPLPEVFGSVGYRGQRDTSGMSPPAFGSVDFRFLFPAVRSPAEYPVCSTNDKGVW